MDSSVQRRLQVIGRHLPVGASNDHAASHMQTHNVCGIVAYVGSEPCVNFLLDGLTILQNRGYDSAGIATISPEHKIVNTKAASVGTTSDAIDRLRKVANVHNKNSVGIAHTRWATHGGKTDRNAHPHLDAKDRVALVHNGVIQNCAELRKEMQAKGIQFRSETDTEVIVQLIGIALDAGAKDLPSAVKEAVRRLEGTWGICVIHKDHPDTIVAARNGSPLLLGLGKDCMYIASEASAFSEFTKDYIALDNGEIAVITPTSHTLDVQRIEHATAEAVLLKPDPFPHWTIREICEQPEAVSRSINYGGRLDGEDRVKLGGLDESRARLMTVKNLVLAACGTSWHAAMFGAVLFRWLRCFETVQVWDAAELVVDALPRNAAGMMVLSQSGETKDVARAVQLAQEQGVQCMSIINAVGSNIARMTKCGVYINAGRENAVASTKAFTCQAICICLVAVWFAQNHDLEQQKRRILCEAISRTPTLIGMTVHRVRHQIAELAEQLKGKRNMFVLGKGMGEAIAREGALKIKEITYLHAEGYPGGALKHGPFALIEEGTPIVLVILDDKDLHMMKIVAEEVKGRGAYVIAITDVPNAIAECTHVRVVIPTNGPLTALLAAVPFQLLAYELAVRRGIDPDKPRNLAKAVTVD